MSTVYIAASEIEHKGCFKLILCPDTAQAATRYSDEGEFLFRILHDPLFKYIRGDPDRIPERAMKVIDLKKSFGASTIPWGPAEEELYNQKE
jgi:hypothetical protein